MMNDKKLKRMLELSNIKTPINEGFKNKSIEFIKKSYDGNTYAIVRENRNYYIMKSETKKVLKENDFDYIGGLQNRTKNSFTSFEDATFKLNVMFNEINRVNGVNENIDMKNFDYVLNEGVYVDKEILTEKRFVLKQPKVKKSEPSMDFGGDTEDTFDFGGSDEKGGEDTFDFGDEGSTEEQPEGGDETFDFGTEDGQDGTEDTFDFEGGDEEQDIEDTFDFGTEEPTDGDTEGGDEAFDFGDEGSTEVTDTEDVGSDIGGDGIKDIQRTTGKLGQQLRDTEDLSSDMQKWVAKSVISALNLDLLDDSDREDIISSLEKKSEPQVDFMGEEPRAGEPSLDSDEEILLDDDHKYCGYLGYSDEVSYMGEDELDIDGPISYMKGRKARHEGMSHWNKSDNESGMGWEIGESASYMGDDTVVDKYSRNRDNYRMNNPEVKPKQPGVKPGTDRPVRPSKNPFTPPSRIRPGEEPAPKARFPQQAPAPTPGTKEPGIKPGTDKPARPSKSPFTPPSRIRPGEEPAPKAGYDDNDVTFR